MDIDEVQDVGVERPAKRFKHQSYKETLKQVHLIPAIAQTQAEYDLSDTDSHFHTALQDWRELSLAPPFVRFANKADGLSASIALLVHHWKEIIDLWLEAVESADDEALKPLLDLLQKITQDLRTTVLPSYPAILEQLLSLLPRSMAAETLSILLPTFTSLFKYVLIPADATSNTIQTAWTAFSDVLPKCDPEVQRAVAEVWGNLLRRMKGDARERCVTNIASSASSDVAAWVFVCSCKSVSQTLHSITPSIIRPLLQYYFSTASNSEASEDTFTVIRRTLTALTHHCKAADQYSPITNILLEYLSRVTSSKDPDAETENDYVSRVLSILAVPCSVRSGSRIGAKNLPIILTQLQLVPMNDELHDPFLKLAVACLTAGDMGLWMGTGRKVFERAWTERPRLALQITGATLELGWGGWQMIALPHIVKRSLDLLESDKETVHVLEVLSAAQKEGKLGGLDDRWKERLQKWAISRLSKWNGAEEQVFELQYILDLVDVIPELGTVLADILKQEYEADEVRPGSAWTLGACMAGLAHRPPREWQEKVDVATLTQKVANNEDFVQSGFVLDGLVKLVNALPPQSDSPLQLQSLYEPLQVSLISYSRLTRLSALRLLASPLVTSSSESSSTDAVKRCLQAEEISVDVQGVRERVLRIGRLNQFLKDDDEASVEVVVRWLVAQLKINLRPLWSSTASAIASISERKGFGDVVWRFVFEELKSSHDLSSLRESEWPPVIEEELDDVNETERTWRDPSAHKTRLATNNWLRSNAAQKAIHQALQVEERFDTNNYELQLLNVLAAASSLTERHNRDLVPYFLSLASPEEPTKTLTRTKLAAWLTVFSKFVNPKALHSSQELRTLFMTLLSHPDRQLQKLALDCVLTFKDPAVAKFEEELKALLDNTRWRDQLTNLDIASIGGDNRAQTIEVLIRLLYGVMLEKKGKSRSKGGVDRRAAVLAAFNGCTSDELETLVDLMLGPILRKRADSLESLEVSTPTPSGSSYQLQLIPDSVSDKQLVGFLTLLGDVMKNLGTKLLPRWDILLQTLLDVIGYAQGRLTTVTPEADSNEEQDDTDAVSDVGSEDDQGRSGTGRAIRAVRQTGLKRFIDFFRSPVSLEFDFTPYLGEAFRSFISPRLPLLNVENTQAPSALLELFHTWTLKPQFAPFLVAYNSQVLPKIYDCLVASSVKPAVISRVFDIVDHLLSLSSADNALADAVFKPGIPLLLTNLTVLVERMKGDTSLTDQLGRRQINILSQLAPYMADSAQASTLLSLFTPILRKSSKTIPEKLKVDILDIIRNLLPLVDGISSSDNAAYLKTFSLFAYLFQSLRSRQARLKLVAVFRALAELNEQLLPLADLLESLNAYSARRMDEPDFERRLSAFSHLNETLHETFTSHQWLPVLHNMLNFIQDPDELSIRSNASASMKRFIDRAAEIRSDYEVVFLRVLFPGLKNGLRSRNELVRAELLGVLSYSIQKCEGISVLQEMRPLLAAGDEEASFFNNILHLQTHRRTRALRRLVEFCNESKPRSATLADVFFPLVANYTTGGAHVDHHLITEAITTLGCIAKHLQWGAYYSSIQQYLRFARQKDESERIYIRTLVSLLDNFHFPMDSVVETDQVPSTEDLEPEEEPEVVPQAAIIDAGKRAIIADVVNTKLLPSLVNHLEKRDENEDSLRIPIAVGIVQVAKHLPPSTRNAQISRLVTVLCQIFRSKSQETRDLTRDTLNKIAVILGPSYLAEILSELRAALLRGPHLHVLAYITHALLVHVTSDAHTADFAILDDCVTDVAHVSAEVIFGESGKDVQSEGFKTKMREVRTSASKGLDSFAIIAKHITPSKISTLLVPIRNILQQTETLKVMQQVEDLLRRIAGGLNANKHVTPVDLLTLCHTLISQNARFLQHVPKPKQGHKARTDAVVEKKKHLVQEADHYANNSSRFIVFGLELFITAHRRSRFDFQDPTVISRLEPMVPVIGNTLYSKHMQVLIPGLKATSAIVKCPLKSIAKSLPVFIRQMIDIVKQTGSTESDVVQTAFKCLATVLRDQPTAQVKEKDLIFLLELLSPDLEEPERQASVFTMLRAIVARKFVVPEIYDLMERVSEIMVTNQSPQVQELCRGVLLQFLLEYPQGKGRLRNNMTFLAKNLSYIHESGRKSVMELLNAILSKFNPDLIREFSDLLFVALVMVVANDESSKCREMASELIKNLFSRLEEPQRRVVMSHIHTWASQQHSQPLLARVSSQIYSILIDHLQTEVAPYVSAILEDLNAIITSSANSFEEATIAEDEDTMDLDVEWQIPYHALTTLTKLLRIQPELAAQTDKITWPHVVSLLLFPHAWVRTASCRLLGMLFAAVPATAPQSSLPDDSPFSVVGMEDTAKKLCLQLRGDTLDAVLGVQVVKNLFYIGKCFKSLEEESVQGQQNGDEEDEDENDEEDEEGEADDNEQVDKDTDEPKRHPLAWLFSKLSYQARSAHIARRNKSSSPPNWFEQPACVFRWFAAMVSFLEGPEVERFLVHILSPLYRIAEDDTIRDSHMDELKTLAVELQDLVQVKVGTTAFSNVYNRIRQKTLGVRRERKTARVVQAATNPAMASKRKQQRNQVKKESRKRKSSSFAESRGRIKRKRDY
ncbi:armadillo-type protein [Irpex rosettiformis]|uniref:Armadillo-type protein n=1 Tax=Irpex rosettiformis TaxID=378272 RepID=A0ACB8U8J3_9APHY|nr:armadillo-type protein [Irpex rosettiformis]